MSCGKYQSFRNWSFDYLKKINSSIKTNSKKEYKLEHCLVHFKKFLVTIVQHKISKLFSIVVYYEELDDNPTPY